MFSQPDTELHLRVPARAERLPEIRRELAAWCHRVDLSEEDTEAVVSAAYEAMANVVDHAYGNRPGPLDLHATCHPGQDNATVTITDDGRWRPPRDPRVTGRGRGLSMIRAYADSVEIRPSAHGTSVRMSWPRPVPRHGRHSG
ncbi:ATP-binding protein [Amycolatopsis magusensis]|uniref:ATP-binding protein n=1 Tax=Amycolatopsis magusensis TaxID=882444 RepID=UPI0037AF182D